MNAEVKPAARAYYHHARPEILQLVPQDAATILDIGCGAGALGHALKQRQSCHVTGVELVPQVATVASEVLDVTLCGDAFPLLAALPVDHFDAVILADVLEHVSDTDGLLTLARDRLKPSGRLILSIPNVRHWSVLLPLLQGEWEYQAEGILDRTHMRFFTRSSMVRAMQRNHLIIENMFARNFPRELPASLFAAIKEAGLQSDDLQDDIQRYQYLIVCKKS